MSSTSTPTLRTRLPVVTKVLAQNPDMLNLGCVGQTGPQLLKLARQLGYEGVMSCSCEDDINLYLNHAGPAAAEGFYIIGSHGFPEGPELMAFREKYTEREGEWTAVALAFYQGIRVLLGGIQKAGTIDDIPAIVKGIQETTVVQELLPGEPVITWGGAKTWGQPHQIAGARRAQHDQGREGDYRLRGAADGALSRRRVRADRYGGG